MASKRPSISQNERSIGAAQAKKKALEASGAAATEAGRKELEVLDKRIKKLGKVLEIQRELLETQQDSLDNFEDIDDELTSIGNRIGKNSKLYEVQKKRIAAGAATLTSISSILKDNQNISEKDRAGLVKYNASYKENLVSVANINRRYAEGKIDKEEANKLIDEATQKYKENTASIELSDEALKQVGPTIKTMNSEIESFGNLAQKSLGHIKHMDEIFESFEGIPALGQLNKLLKTNIRDTLAFKAAVFALGAALGKAAYDYFGAPIKAAMQADKERHQNEIDTIADVAKLRKDAQFIPAKIGQERLEAEIEATNQINNLMHEAAYAGQKAAVQFSASMQTGAAQFERAAKTALFGNKLGSVGYGAAQLQLAGISADKIASSMEAASAATGKMPSASAAADMAVMAERTGQSVDDIASINEAFMRMDGMSANVAMNMQEGMRNMADQAGIGLGNLMKEVAEASKEALGYQIKSGPALAKAVAYTQSMGLNFGDVAKAGKNMVLNYKDSIKAEMQLSSMLGEQVDLAEVRAKFAAGDTEGALSSLKSQGLDPADMDQFQQQALQDALGGMDLNSLQKVAQNTGKEVGLSGGNAKGGNKDFLSRTQSAEASLSAQQASISAQTAIVDAKLSKEIADAYLASPEYLEYKKKQAEASVAARELEGAMTNAWKATDEYKKSLSDTMKLNFVDTIKEGLMSGLAVIGGGMVTSLINKLIPKGKAASIASAITGGGAGGGGADGGASGGATGGPIASVAAQISAAEPILGKAKTLGQNLKDFGQGVGSFIKSVGAGMGKAIEAILGGFGRGMAVIGANAAYVIAGGAAIAAVIASIGAGIAGASWIMGKALPTLAEGLMSFNDVDGSNLKSVGLGVAALGAGLVGMGAGAVLTGIGNLVGELFGGGIEDTIKKVEKFSEANINAAKVKNNADAVVAYAKSMVAMGAGNALGGIGNLVGAIADSISGFFEKEPPIEKMKKFAAYNFNAKKVGENAEAVVSYAKAMAAMGAGNALGGIGNMVGAIADSIAGFFQKKPPIEKMKEFARYDLNAKKVEENAKAVTAYAKAMAALGAGSAISGLGAAAGAIGSAVAKFFGAEPPLAKLKAFAAADLGDIKNLEKNAKAFTIFGMAMQSYKGTGESMWHSLGQSIAKFFGGTTPLEKMKAFAAADLGDISNLENNAKAFTLFGNAMASYQGTKDSMWHSLGESIANFFGGTTPLEKMKAFAAETFDPIQVGKNAEAFVLFGNAMASYKGADQGFFAQLGEGLASFFSGGKTDLMQKFREFAALNAAGIQAAAAAIVSFNNALLTFNVAHAAVVGPALSSITSNINLGTGGMEYDALSEMARGMNEYSTALGTASLNIAGIMGLTSGIDTIATAFTNLAIALQRLSEVNPNSINNLPWGKMIGFANAGGRITLAQSATNSFNIAADSARNIAQLATDTKANLQVSKNLQALIAVLADNGENATQLIIDGKNIATMIKRREDNIKARNPGE